MGASVLFVGGREGSTRLLVMCNKNSAWWLGRKWRTWAQLWEELTHLPPADLESTVKGWRQLELETVKSWTWLGVWWGSREGGRAAEAAREPNSSPEARALRDAVEIELERRRGEKGCSGSSPGPEAVWDTVKGKCDMALSLASATDALAGLAAAPGWEDPATRTLILRAWATVVQEAQDELRDVAKVRRGWGIVLHEKRTGIFSFCCTCLHLPEPRDLHCLPAGKFTQVPYGYQHPGSGRGCRTRAGQRALSGTTFDL
jgi:hypothetical protein